MKEIQFQSHSKSFKTWYVKTKHKKIIKTFDGFSYAFTELDIHEKELDGLCDELNNYTLLRDFNCSNNKIKDISHLSHMPYISKINCSTNAIKDISIFAIDNSFQFLQILNLK